MKNRLLLSITIFTLFVLHGIAQPMVGITLDKDTIEPGDRVRMKLKLSSPSNVGSLLVDYSPLDTLENIAMINDSTRFNEGRVDIEWIDAPFAKAKEKVGVSVTRDSTGQYAFVQDITFTVWDIGIFRMPLPLFVGENGDTLQVRALQSPTLFSLLPQIKAPQDTTQIIHTINTIILEPKNWKDYLWLIILASLLIAGALLFLAVNRRKQKQIDALLEQSEEEKPFVPAHITAFEKLKALRAQRLWEKGKVKEYQTELTFVIREYLENRFDIQALESTTSEVIADLEDKDFDTKQASTLSRILQIADLVKFAKATPSAELHESFLDDAENFVSETKLEIIESEGDGN